MYRFAVPLSAMPLAVMLLLVLLALAGCDGDSGKTNTDATAGKPASTRDIANTPIAGNPAANTGKTVSELPVGSGFDFYVLSLSWSPTWCLENDPSGRSQQCADRNRATGKSHGFVVHGLWPQNEKGYPEFCRTNSSDRVPEALGRTLFDIMPSMGLIGHEWRKHGSCSGLGQRDYFAVLRAARQKIKVPPALQNVEVETRTSAADIEASLVLANPGLNQDGLAVTCAAGRVEEVRICFDKSLNFRACSEIDRSGCRIKSLGLPATP